MGNKTTWVRAFILAAALALIAAGLLDGGGQDMMNKAVRICFECIGIG